MAQPTEPIYDFNHPVFKQRRQLVKLAKEHINLAGMKSDVIEWEAVQTTDLGIPVTYHVTYHIRSIIGLDAAQHPIFGNRHVAEMSLGPLYPLEPCKVYMKTDLWHPNIKWDGRLKGRVCSNVDKFGIAFDLYGLVLWVGEILQYKNYHAKNEPPFPEDLTVAEWVLGFAEPEGIVNKEKGIFIDETPLLRVANGAAHKAPEQPKQEPVAAENVTVAAVPIPIGMLEPLAETKLESQEPAPEEPKETPPPAEEIKDGKFKISMIRKTTPPPSQRLSIKINPR